MKPAEHYARARELMAQAERSWDAGSNDPTQRAERLERLQMADVHTKLGQLAAVIGDEQTFLSSNRRTRVVLTLPTESDGALGALTDLLDSVTMAAEALAGHDADGRGPDNALAWQALRDRTVWDTDDDMRRFAATDTGDEP